jgi:hypothetical protein
LTLYNHNPDYRGFENEHFTLDKMKGLTSLIRSYDSVLYYCHIGWNYKHILVMPQIITAIGRASKMMTVEENKLFRRHGIKLCPTLLESESTGLSLNPDAKWYFGHICPNDQRLEIGTLDDDFSDVLKRKQSLAKKIRSAILMDNKDIRRRYTCEMCVEKAGELVS